MVGMLLCHWFRFGLFVVALILLRGRLCVVGCLVVY